MKTSVNIEPEIIYWILNFELQLYRHPFLADICSFMKLLKLKNDIKHFSVKLLQKYDIGYIARC